jgi:nucleoside phosphorylase
MVTHVVTSKPAHGEAEMTDVHLAILTPLAEEWLAVRQRLTDPVDVPSPYQTVKGRIGGYTVVACFPGDPANSVSADFTRFVADTWKPRWIVLLGVAGGFPEHGVRTGDVVMATRVYPYEYGKTKAGNYERRDRFDFKPDVTWVSRAQTLQLEKSTVKGHWSKKVGVPRPDRSRTRPRLHVGPVASGDKVIDDPTYPLYRDAVERLPDIFAVEMEAAGATITIDRLRNEGRAIGFFMVRGISDAPRAPGVDADAPRETKERDDWKPYAAAAAAAFLEALLSLPGAPEPVNRGQAGTYGAESAGLGQSASVVQVIDVADLESLALRREWLRPIPPRPTAPLVGRGGELDTIRTMLTRDQDAAVMVVVCGPPGIGKTALAEHVAARCDEDFPGGVLFEHFGAGFRDSTLVATVANRWAEYAYGGRTLPLGVQLSAGGIRSILGGQGRMLIVLDDIWEPGIVQELRSYLPPESVVLVTARSERVATELRGETYRLDVLPEGDALELLRKRARNATDADAPVLSRLVGVLGGHPQALDIAGGGIVRLPRGMWPAAVETMAQNVRTGTGFGDLSLPGDEVTESQVAAALAFSYADLGETGQRRFRALGAFAPDASFRTGAAALLWNMPPEEALGQLLMLAERGLLSRLDAKTGDVRWQQHSLIRAYALMLLRRDGEEAEARRNHAELHLTAIRYEAADQGSYRLLPDYQQLEHAFEWAVENDLQMAQDLAGFTADIQTSFNMVPESHRWAVLLAQASESRGDDRDRGLALGTLANAITRLAALPDADRGQLLSQALSILDNVREYFPAESAGREYAMVQNNRGNILIQLASLPGEDRGTRLKDALDALDDALRHRPPEAAPERYGTTQSNRAHLLTELASLPGADEQRLLAEALAAVDGALGYLDPGTEPLDYAKAQNVKGNVLSRLSVLPTEDRSRRLAEASVAYRASLEFRPFEADPLQHVITLYNAANVLFQRSEFAGPDQRAVMVEALETNGSALEFLRQTDSPIDLAAALNNRAPMLLQLSTLSGEDRAARLGEALQCAWAALLILTAHNYAPQARLASLSIRAIRAAAGEDFTALWADLGVGDPPEWLVA